MPNNNPPGFTDPLSPSPAGAARWARHKATPSAIQRGTFPRDNCSTGRIKGLTMPFEKYVAIDWSGSRRPRLTPKIQVAEYDPADRTVAIVRSPFANGRWSRAGVFEQMQRWFDEHSVLIGFDFAFAYPYADRGAYFPCGPPPPADVRQLWATVERVCGPDDNFYGGPFYRGPASPFRHFHLCHDCRGANYEERFRVTDQRAVNAAGRHPSSVFRCVGPNQVGPGSVAGMRFLHWVHQEQIATIWPFDPPDRTTMVEIYPRLFLNHAEIIRSNPPDPATVAELVECYGATLRGAPEQWTDDERDALVSAAGMGWFANQPPTWQAPTHAATHEGWIFGVQ